MMIARSLCYIISYRKQHNDYSSYHTMSLQHVMGSLILLSLVIPAARGQQQNGTGVLYNRHPHTFSTSTPVLDSVESVSEGQCAVECLQRNGEGCVGYNHLNQTSSCQLLSSVSTSAQKTLQQNSVFAGR